VDSLRGAQRQAVQAAHHEPTARGSAPSGDLCDARLTRAPQEISESPGSPFWVTFLAKQKGDWPRAATERARGDTKHVAVYQFVVQSDCTLRGLRCPRSSRSEQAAMSPRSSTHAPTRYIP
jgi:hypothetical protein